MAAYRNRVLELPFDALLDHWQRHRRVTRRVIDGVSGGGTLALLRCGSPGHARGAPAPLGRDDPRDRHVLAQIPAGRFGEIDKVFGEYEGPVDAAFLYWIENEGHHRGQGYVYPRALGIEPPAFCDRSRPSSTLVLRHQSPV